MNLTERFFETTANLREQAVDKLATVKLPAKKALHTAGQITTIGKDLAIDLFVQWQQSRGRLASDLNKAWGRVAESGAEVQAVAVKGLSALRAGKPVVTKARRVLTKTAKKVTRKAA